MSQMAEDYWNVAGSITNPAGMLPYLQAVEPYLPNLVPVSSAEISKQMHERGILVTLR